MFCQSQKYAVSNLMKSCTCSLLFQCVATWRYKLNHGSLLCILSKKSSESYSSASSGHSHLELQQILKQKKDMLATKLNLSDKNITNFIKKHPRVLDVSLENLKANLDVTLQDGKISPKLLFQNGYILTIDPEHLKKNLEFLKLLKFEEEWHKNRRLVKDISSNCEISEMELDNIYREKKELLASFNVSNEDIDKFFKTYPQVVMNTSISKMKTVLDITLRDGFVPTSMILHNGQIFNLGIEQLTIKLQFLKQLTKKTMNSEVKTLNASNLEKLTYKKLKTMVCLDSKRLLALEDVIENHKDYMCGRTKLEYLSVELDCSIETIKVLIKEHPFINSIKFPKLGENLMLLLSSGYVKRRDILQYPRVLMFKTATLKRRIQHLNQMDFHIDDKININAFLKGSEFYFRKFTQQLRIEREILLEEGCSDRNEYVRKRLQCSAIDLESMMKSCSRQKMPRLQKVKTVLDFVLIECQMTKSEIVNCASVFNVSVNTMQIRKEECDELGVHVSPYMLSVSSTTYRKALNKQGCVNV